MNKRIGSGQQTAILELIDGSTIMPEPIDWLWRGWLARGKFHILAGAPSTGKTTLALSMAAIITRGGVWPDGTPAQRGYVLIWSGEDGIEDTLTPRLIAAGADMTRVKFIGNVLDDAGFRGFDPAYDLEKLEEELALLPEPPSLLVIDPIVAAVAGDSHKNAETRRSLAPLVNLIQRQNCALLGISHFTKGTSGRDPVERVTGSVAFGAISRLVLVTVRRPDDHPDGPARMLVRAKCNIGPDGGGYCYEVEETALDGHPGVITTCTTWGESINGTARALLADAELMGDGIQKEASALDTATKWLYEHLSGGPKTSKQVIEDGEQEGHAARTIQRAKKALKVETVQSGFSGSRQSLWSLPAGTFSP